MPWPLILADDFRLPERNVISLFCANCRMRLPGERPASSLPQLCSVCVEEQLRQLEEEFPPVRRLRWVARDPYQPTRSR
jgi:hypothetical protein